MNKIVFKTRFTEFFRRVGLMVQREHEDSYALQNLKHDMDLEPGKEDWFFDEGRKYIKVWKRHYFNREPSSSSWGWVDKTTGSIRRGSWKAIEPLPKTKRTFPNVFDSDYGMWGCKWTGPAYTTELETLMKKAVKRGVVLT